MDSHTLILLVFGSLIAFAVTLLALASLIGFGFWYFDRMWNKHSILMQHFGFAMGELNAYKKQEIRLLRGKKEKTFLWFKRIIDKLLYLEFHDGTLTRAIGDTDDLSVFAELSPEEAVAIQRLLVAGVAVASTIAGASAGPPVLH